MRWVLLALVFCQFVMLGTVVVLRGVVASNQWDAYTRAQPYVEYARGVRNEFENWRQRDPGVDPAMLRRPRAPQMPPDAALLGIPDASPDVFAVVRRELVASVPASIALALSAVAILMCCLANVPAASRLLVRSAVGVSVASLLACLLFVGQVWLDVLA